MEGPAPEEPGPPSSLVSVLVSVGRLEGRHAGPRSRSPKHCSRPGRATAKLRTDRVIWGPEPFRLLSAFQLGSRAMSRTPWRRFSVRLGAADLDAGPYEGVPPHLLEPLRSWVSAMGAQSDGD